MNTQSTTMTANYTAKRMHQVLVVDDEVTHLRHIQKILPKEEFRFLRAVNGISGCLLAKERQPDLIIMDWQMPEMNGIEAIHELKKNEETRHIPVIMATGVMIESEHLATALNAGAVDFVQKPFDPIEVQARVHAALQLSDAHQKIRKKNAVLEAQQKELQASNDELEDQMQLLEYAYQEKNNLLDMIGREIITPLTRIKGVARLIGIAGKVNSQQANYLETIKESLSKGESLLQEIIDIEKLDINDKGFHIQQLKPASILRSQLDNSEYPVEDMALMRFNDVDIEEIESDEKYLRQILQALVWFSMEHLIDFGSVQLNLFQDGEKWGVELSQENCGLTDMDMHGLFLKYNDIRGLHVVKLLVTQLNGHLSWSIKEEKLSLILHLPKQYSYLEGASSSVSEPLLSIEEIEYIHQLLMEQMEGQTIFKDPEITLDALANLAKTTGKKLSYVIHQKYKENFKTFLNRYRVEEAKRLLSDNSYSHYTYLGIGYEAGFNSKSAFYRGFKDFTGMTPKAYQAQTQK